jgi:hypothetical protein
MEHRTTAELEAALDDIRRAPVGVGRVELIVRRPTDGVREVLDEGQLDTASGLVGDNWIARGSKETEDGSAHPLRQLNVMSARAAAAIAGPVENWPLAGDQFFVDLQLGGEELPTGTRLQIGDAIIEVTSPPHLGCAKFVSRFGKEAMRFVNSPVGRSLNLRGICARVVVGGTIRTGDTITGVLAPEALTTA